MKRVLVAMPIINLWADYVKNAIESIVSKENKVRILAIDNGSKDGTRDKLKELADAKVIEFFDNGKNLGVSGAWNQALQYAFVTRHLNNDEEFEYDYALIVNSDILLHENCIDEMVRVMEEKKDCYLLTAANIRGQVPVVSQAAVNNVKGSPVNSYSPHPDFACFMVRPETVEKVGYFDEGFFPAFHEDNDYHRRMKLAIGSDSALSCSKAMFYHFGSRTWFQRHEGMNDELKFIASKEYYVKKWGGEVNYEQFKIPFNKFQITMTSQEASFYRYLVKNEKICP